jgi:hypothetical protein
VLKGFGLGAGAAVAASAAVLAFAPVGSAGPAGPGLATARNAAREAVREHPSYRVIRSSHPLRVRRCWRRSHHVTRCSLYRVAPTPCALNGRDGICAQVLARRIWLVDVRLRRGRAVARIVRVVDGN